MRRTFVLSLGTAGCAAALHFRRRREGELRYLRRRLLRTSQEERPVLEQRYQQLLGAVRILAIDLDGTDAYRLPPPLDVEGSTWKAGETLKITLNPRDVIERFQSGQLPEVVEQVNPGYYGAERAATPALSPAPAAVGIETQMPGMTMPSGAETSPAPGTEKK